MKISYDNSPNRHNFKKYIYMFKKEITDQLEPSGVVELFDEGVAECIRRIDDTRFHSSQHFLEGYLEKKYFLFFIPIG